MPPLCPKRVELCVKAAKGELKSKLARRRPSPLAIRRRQRPPRAAPPAPQPNAEPDKAKREPKRKPQSAVA